MPSSPLPLGYTNAMGLFSLFRKGKLDDIVDEDEAYARLAADSELLRQPDQSQLDLQRDIARATVLKIDAIEAAMAADIFADPEPAFRRPPRPRPAHPAPDDGATLPLLDEAVTELQGDDETPAEAAAAERAPAVEEAAILYADGRVDDACALLAGAIASQPRGDRTIWWMLFDLYQLTNRAEAFDSLSIDYASTFETSPPSWNGALAEEAGAYTGVTPTATLAGVLDASAAPQIARFGDIAQGAAVLRLDFSRVTAVEPEGCALLVDALRIVQRGRELMLVGAGELLAQVKGIVDVGRRDEGEAPWLLLLELLRLLNREKEFEEASMDYCVTFEVSPPPFTPPGKVASTPRQLAAPAADRYLLPRQMTGDAGDVLAGIRAYADASPALVLDCSRLARMDYGAAGQLLALLTELAADGRRIEFRELNHLTAALLRLLDFGAVARLFPHRY
ncbi:ABC-type transporter Mla MlaB component [Pseudoduganella flava]|uniref:ABC-type transporter Mla MlaB component n=2 Tax=Pseudoduganella flava TaxID=871742 RepID=A0A562PP93_9BURK|nr:ABC-type transporter Mla MlaB component [Pseudoduganella flava]